MRERKSRLWPIAMSPSKAADALGIRPEQVQAAIFCGALPCYKIGVKRRVLVRDLYHWIRRNWRRVP